MVLKSQTRLVKDLGRVSFLLRFSGMFLDNGARQWIKVPSSVREDTHKKSVLVVGPLRGEGGGGNPPDH